ncbi:Glucomannan 4-beta-mannosyltransferase 9 [Apostasia shenzhenica]|uniref:glucomannan 4-beta-mannosyltransferase n=1 Tax=Apostasia shenzhenica TaxID=1088818 RepID=A0A2I0AV67_9ASPA|nr:Glucomannan 4-beta-mannosyltransferase 9 [Apostasia shenzhenica]
MTDVQPPVFAFDPVGNASSLNLAPFLHHPLSAQSPSILLLPPRATVTTSVAVAEWARAIGLSFSGGLELIEKLATGALPEQICSVWSLVRTKAIAPVLRVLVVACLIMSVMLMMDVTFMAVVSLTVKLFRLRPEKRYKWEAIRADVETGSLAYPMVLVQIPMYNEREVYKLSIGAACTLSWPADRIIIQVLDDSTDPAVKDLVALECKLWAGKGMNITYEVRDNRKGFKAGALKRGMEHGYVQQCEFVAIFDADFQPEADFLMRTIPYLVSNSNIALVQARWEFVNYSECLMTRIQRISLDYHFKVEQESGSSTFAFFGFNGTAGVWRVSAMEEAGGWKDRTTVEDMDLAVRAGLKGWKLLYAGNVKVKCELPSTFMAYRKQQHRWTCGAANLFRKVALNIIMTKNVSTWKKLHVVYSFFFVRKIVTHIVTFLFYSVVVPASVLVPEVTIPLWGVMYIPTAITLLNAIRNPRLIHIMPFWVLFENVMSFHRMKATLVGLLEMGNVNEWVVTEKLGEALKTKETKTKFWALLQPIAFRINFSELGFAAYLFFCASYNVAFGKNHYYVYLYVQAFAFTAIGFGYSGSAVCNS